MLREKVTRFAKSACRNVGFDVIRWRPQRVESTRLLQVIRQIGAQTVVDVGANVGQFATGLWNAGFVGQVISFEPLQLEHQQLTRRAAVNPNWIVAERCALGDSDEMGSIHRAANSVSSSVLQMTATHVNAAPLSENVGEELVAVRRLDSCRELTRALGPLFLKVDTQGYELHVLSGAAGLMDRVQGMLLEASLVPLYEGSPLVYDVLKVTHAMGFVLHDLFLGFQDPSGQLLQVDLVLVRS